MCILFYLNVHGQGGCLPERQREFVPGSRTQNGERARVKSSRTFGLWDFQTKYVTLSEGRVAVSKDGERRRDRKGAWR